MRSRPAPSTRSPAAACTWYDGSGFMDADDRKLLMQIAIIGGALSATILSAAALLAIAVRIFELIA